ncbi:hypothetical protein [Algoriphagus winogradskyi]|uniref:Uncharacterized protein n=1 Tax=Algoriphagus winogradskyi TaxID=237017 RepID=A0ABY1PAC3_9BACT|nr:hypothetical protein [Algoriphagus winogradskyi]SMP28800.1 hypothetical protein SAMN06265367_10647 [Algoriphagus winogradskyi]
MNTKLVMTSSAILMYAAGIILTFAPDLILQVLELSTDQISLFLMQIVGALYFGFGMLNWMNKGRPIGGIYNRPVAIANLSHFMIAGLALLKGLLSTPELPSMIWVVGILYIGFGITFGVLLFRHPIADRSKTK